MSMSKGGLSSERVALGVNCAKWEVAWGMLHSLKRLFKAEMQCPQNSLSAGRGSMLKFG